MRRTRLLARLADEQVRYIYCVAQPGSGRRAFFEETAGRYGPAAVCVVPTWDDLSAAETAQFREWILSQRIPAGKFVLVSGADPGAPNPFDGIAPEHVSFYNDADMAYTLDEIEETIGDVPHSAGFAQFVLENTGGYPASVAYIRRVLAAEGEDVARNFDGTAYTPLKRYLYEQLIAPLPHDELAVLISAAALNDADEALLSGVLPAHDVRAELQRLEARGLLVPGHGGLAMRPLLARALRAQRGDDLKLYAAGTIDALIDSGDYLSAARVAVETDKPLDALAFLARLPAAEFVLSSPDLTDVLRRLPADLLTFEPRLWLGVSYFRHFEVDTEVMLAEADSLLAFCALSEDPEIVKGLRGAKAYLHMHAGEFDAAEALLSEQYPNGFPAPEQCTRGDAFFLGTIAYALAQKGEMHRASEMISRLSLMNSLPFVSYVMTLINIRRTRHSGNWKAQRAFLDQLLHSARSRHPLAQARALHELVQGALIADDTEALEHARATMRNLALHNDLGPFEAYASVAGMPPSREIRFGTPQQRGQMHLLEAYYAGSVEEARSGLLRCMEESDSSLAFFGRILARVGLAELLPHRRAALIAEAKVVAQALGERPLDAALSHLAIGELPSRTQPLRAFAQHFRVLATRVNEDLPIAVNAVTATLQRAGQPIHVSRRVFDLLLALAVRGRPVERDELCEMLWPDQLPAEAANALKMTVRRARLQTGDPTCVQVVQNRYALGAHVACDFRDLRSSLEPVLKNGKALRAHRDEALAFVRGISHGIPPHLAEYEWFVGTAASLQHLAIEVSAALARQALDENDLEWGAQLAAAMIVADPCDELAWELNIRALLARGETGAASRAYREYSTQARAANVPVSPAVTRLVAP